MNEIFISFQKVAEEVRKQKIQNRLKQIKSETSKKINTD